MKDTKKNSEMNLKEFYSLLQRNPMFFVGEIYREAIEKSLESEVKEKAGERYEGKRDYNRWGSNPGSISANGERIPIRVPRLRNKISGETREPEIYRRINRAVQIPEQMIRSIINGMSQRKYKHVAKIVSKSFGLSQSVVSRKFQKSAKSALNELMNRDLGNYEFVSIVIDGKYLSKEQIVHAVGITSGGDKIVLGFVQTTTENSEAIKGLLRNLIERNLRYEGGILLICDGAKGIRKAADEIFGKKAVIQRCQWHKRENVLSYLPEYQKSAYKRRITEAYNQPQYETARTHLKIIAEELGRINPSAEKSMEEGLEETLTVHRLGLREELGKSLCTTNLIENFNSQLEKRFKNVKRWRPGKMRFYWSAISLLEIEKFSRKIHHYEKLNLLKIALATVTMNAQLKTA